MLACIFSCLILSFYLILLFEQKDLSSRCHSSTVFLLVSILYIIFWKNSVIHSRMSVIIFLISFLSFLVLFIGSIAKKKNTLMEVCYFIVASYTVVEMWALATEWCCNGQKSSITYYVIKKFINSTKKK